MPWNFLPIILIYYLIIILVLSKLHLEYAMRSASQIMNPLFVFAIAIGGFMLAAVPRGCSTRPAAVNSQSEIMH